VRVVDVEVTVVGTSWRELTFVELITDNGMRGVGEVRMVNKTDTLMACIAELADRHVLGMDPFDRQTLAFRIQRLEYGRPGEVTQSALAALDVCCWDLIGQQLGVPIWKLLGGRYRERVPAYANGWYQTERTPEAIAECARRVVERGYRALKLDPFGAAKAHLAPAEQRGAIEIVRAVRSAVGPDVQIMIEMHGRLSPFAAAVVAAELEKMEPAWIEEPVSFDVPTGLTRVRQATNTPIATGERVHTMSEFRPLIESGLVDVIQADLTHFGGLTGLQLLAGWAETYGLLLAPHNVCGPVGTAANVHFAVATPNYLILEHFNDFADTWVDQLVDVAPSVDPSDGCFSVPTAPGLGMRLNHERCAEHPRTHSYFSLFTEGWERRGESVDAPRRRG
jgi:galactonate dehydratase